MSGNHVFRGRRRDQGLEVDLVAALRGGDGFSPKRAVRNHWNGVLVMGFTRSQSETVFQEWNFMHNTQIYIYIYISF